MRTPKQQERLIRLRDHMKIVKDENFDMCSWIQPTEEQLLRVAKGELTLTDTIKEHACGSSACILGHATEIFEEFALQNHTLLVIYLNGVSSLDFDTIGVSYFDAEVANFFGITVDEADYLSSSAYPERTVAEAVRILDQLIEGIQLDECDYDG